jgi:hypothetical protein
MKATGNDFKPVATLRLPPASFISRFSFCIIPITLLTMPKPRGREHSSLTETAEAVVYELKKIPGIKMIAPGEIRANKRSAAIRFVTANYTVAGFELLISGQSAQKVAVHTERNPKEIFIALKESKKLRDYVFKERERKPGV